MPLFDVKERTDPSPMKETENHYQFYDRSSREEMQQKRNDLNNWILCLSASEQKEIISRMKEDKLGFISSEIELTLHHILSNLGYSITIHPELKSGKKPDFLAENENLKFFLEATVVYPSEQQNNDGKRSSNLIQRINEMKLPKGHFFILEDITGDKSNPKINKIIAILKAFVNENAPLQSGEQIKAEFELEKWCLTISLFNTGRDKIFNRAIGMHSGGAGYIDPAGDMKKRLERKAKHYGKFSNPYIIAIADCVNPMNSENDILDCLIGKRNVRVNTETGAFFPERNFDGFFGYKEKPQNTNVSAVILYPETPYWSAKNNGAQPLIVHNPFAEFHLEHGVLNMNTRYLNEAGDLISFEGKSFKKLLFES